MICKKHRRLLAAPLITALAVSGCSGGDAAGPGQGGTASVDACTESVKKDFVLSVTREWYLFPDLLPPSPDPSGFATANDLLAHLTATAREQRKDRYFSYLTSRTEDDSVLGEGRFEGFGFRVRTEPDDRAVILEVFEGSPAAESELRRGDEIVAIDAGEGFVPVSQLLADGRSVLDALGPSQAGVQRGLRLLRAGTTVDVRLVKRPVIIDPVPDGYGAQILPLAGTTGVGYLHLRSYISTADAQLRDAFAEFRARDLGYFIVDLRYNGGGRVDTAEVLGNLLGAARERSDVQFRMTYGPAKSAWNDTRFFRPDATSVRPVRIAFLTSGATASSSETSINSMSAWVEVAIVGGNTYGKPVGQSAFDLPGCDDRLRLLTFRVDNALGQSNYYDGLAATQRFACAATDTLDRAPGDPEEGLTAAALDWLRTGSCAAVITPAVDGRTKVEADARPAAYPLPRSPSAAQLWLPGVA